MAVIQPLLLIIIYQCANFGDDRTSFNVICDVCDDLITCIRPICIFRYFWCQKCGERCQALACGGARYLPSLIALLTKQY